MTLLFDIEPVIANGLNSLGKHLTKRMEDMYYFYAAKHIHDTLDAFIVLRGQDPVGWRTSFSQTGPRNDAETTRCPREAPAFASRSHGGQ